MDSIQKELSVGEFSVTRNGSDLTLFHLLFSLLVSFPEGHLFCGNLRTKTRHSTDFYGNQMHRRQLAFAKMAVATGANRPRFVLLVSNHSHFHILYN